MQQTIDRLSRELGLPAEVVTKTYKAYWKFIRSTIESFPLKEDIGEDKFSRLRTNFNIPNLGKLVCTYEKYKGIKKRYKIRRGEYAEYKENKTNGQLLGDHKG